LSSNYHRFGPSYKKDKFKNSKIKKWKTETRKNGVVEKGGARIDTMMASVYSA